MERKCFRFTKTKKNTLWLTLISSTRLPTGAMVRSFEFVDDFADECFMPLTVGGGVAEVKDVKKLLQVGADKVAINSVAVNNPELIIESAKIFGAQCIVVSIDVKKDNEGTYEVISKKRF